MNRTPQTLFDIAACPHVPDDLDLYPRIAAHLDGRTSKHALRARPALSFLIALFILLILSGVAYAFGHSLGYIPGVGLVDQSVPIRSLAEPASLTRDGITLTVNQAVLTADKTVVLFTLEGVPGEALAHGQGEHGCNNTPYLRLPDNSTLEMIGGGGPLYENRFVYPAVPQEIDHLTLVMPCILGTLPDKVPEYWELTLYFVPTPGLPIAEVIDMPLPTVVPTYSDEMSAGLTPLKLKQVIDTEGGYIFLLTFSDLSQSDDSSITAFMSGINVTDANGKPVYVSYAGDVDPSDVSQSNEMAWAYRLNSKSQAWPLTFRGQTAQISTLTTNTAFTFDTGANPQPGQEWILNQDIQVGDYNLRVISARLNYGPLGACYSFTFVTVPEVNGLGLEIAGATATGGGGGSDGQGSISTSLSYTDATPEGKLRVVITTLTTHHPGPTYSVTWQPEGASNLYQSLYGISLVVDRYIPTDDGYYLIGHTECADERIVQVTEHGIMLAFDARGNNLNLEKVNFPEAQTLIRDLQANQWTYRLYETSFSGPLTLRLSRVNVEFKQPIRFTLDLRPYGFAFSDEQIGIPWKIGLVSLYVPEIGADVFRVTYIRDGELHGFEFALEADPRLQMLALNFEDGVITYEQTPHSEDTKRDQQNGLLLITVLTDEQLSMPLTMISRGATVTGMWETNWTPSTH